VSHNSSGGSQMVPIKVFQMPSVKVAPQLTQIQQQPSSLYHSPVKPAKAVSMNVSPQQQQ
jgi:hypothetical protein